MVLLYDDAGVMASKAKCIAQSGSDGSLLCLHKSKVETRIQVGIVCKMIDGWRDFVIDNTHDASDRFDYTCSPQTMTRH